MKNIAVSLILVFTLTMFSTLSAHSQDDALLKSDFKTAYEVYNTNLKNEKTTENYLNMCKVTYMLRDNNTAKLYCKEALNYIEREKSPNLELRADIFQMLGNIYAAAYNNNDITFEYLNQAKELKENNLNTDKYELAKLYKTIAYMYNYTGNSLLSDEYYAKSLDILVENSSEKKFNVIEAAVYNDLALIEKRKQNYGKSKEYLDKALEKLITSDDYVNYSLLADVYENIAEYYEYNKHDKTTAVEYYKKSVEANRKFPDKDKRETPLCDLSAQDTFDELLSQNKSYPYDINNNLLLGFYSAKSDKKDFESYFQKALSVNYKNPYVYTDIAYLYLKLYLNGNKVNSDYFDKAKLYIKSAEDKGKYSPEIYYSLGKTSMNLNLRKKAENYFKKYLQYSDNKIEAVNNIQSYFNN